MIVIMLLLIVAGIGFTQAVSDPHRVTLRWLRLGGMIAAALLAVAFVLGWRTEPPLLPAYWPLFAGPAICVLGQLVTVQQGKRRTQRAFALLVLIASVLAVGWLIPVPQGAGPTWFATTWSGSALSGALLGGFLMTMLLGHAYLTAGGEMSQKPFRHLVLALAVVLLLRAVGSGVFALGPWLQEGPHRSWTVMLITTRYLVGLGLPAVFTWMIHDCVKRHANQSATGILYVALILVVLGEGTAMALLDETGLMF